MKILSNQVVKVLHTDNSTIYGYYKSIKDFKTLLAVLGYYQKKGYTFKMTVFDDFINYTATVDDGTFITIMYWEDMK